MHLQRHPFPQQRAFRLRLRTVAAVCSALAAACGFLAFSGGCDDRLPTNFTPSNVIDTVSVNSFVVSGNGYSNTLFNLSASPARAYYFAADTLSSVWKADLVLHVGRDPVQVVLQAGFPGSVSGSWEWENAADNPNARCKLVLRMDTDEYASVSGSTQVWFHSDGSRITLIGTFAGTLRSKTQQVITVRDGHFLAEYF